MERARNRSERYLEPLVDLVEETGISPDLLSVLSLVAAIGAGLGFYFSAFIVGGALVLANGLLDAVDGALARRLGVESRRGDLVDHTIDRFADVSILLGLTFSTETPERSIQLGLFAIVGVLLTSYMGTQAQAVGAGRVYSGMLGRAYRILMILAAALAAAFTSYSSKSINALLAFFAIVGIYTAVQRFVSTLRGLD